VTSPYKNHPFSRYLLPPVWIIESILASSNNSAKEQLRCLLQGPAAGLIMHSNSNFEFLIIASVSGAVALHERLSRPSLLASMAFKGNTESLSFLLRLQAPGIPFLVGRHLPFAFQEFSVFTTHH
jgi:hypothetical protein